MITCLSSRGRIVIPAELRQQDGTLAGQKFKFEQLGRGNHQLMKVAEPVDEGLVEWLLTCLGKAWFRSVESGSTDSF
jgi:bifunctional DNA-binding transcriptional regulator/antitoxin component of YhaV-PrlF toxin-antitoxin module